MEFNSGFKGLSRIIRKTHKRGTKAKVRDEAGNAEVCMSEPNQSHHHGAFPPLIRFCEGRYGTTDPSNSNRESSPSIPYEINCNSTHLPGEESHGLEKRQSLKIISFHTGPTLFRN